ncbi:hypothetical protein C5167_007030 [Papaver somniferum]|uniref:Uncharacterized protein n=1 Tax=Papaver somniferum TaxID=3469 RepID=A0A4Y7JF05_PAPSO|nr:hypothetical protein C5167_007030 [Papaver somniferum]
MRPSLPQVSDEEHPKPRRRTPLQTSSSMAGDYKNPGDTVSSDPAFARSYRICSEFSADDTPKKLVKKDPDHSYVDSDKRQTYSESYVTPSDTRKASSRDSSLVPSGKDLLSRRGSQRDDEWSSDLLGCCAEPALEKMVLQTQFSQVRTPVAVTPLPTGIVAYHLGGHLHPHPQQILSFPIPTIAWDEAKCFPKLYDAIPAPATMASWTKNDCKETWEPTTTNAATTSEACASMVKYHRNLTECGYRALIFRGCKQKKVVPAMKRMCFSGIPCWVYLQGYDNNLIILTIKIVNGYNHQSQQLPVFYSLDHITPFIYSSPFLLSLMMLVLPVMRSSLLRSGFGFDELGLLKQIQITFVCLYLGYDKLGHPSLNPYESLWVIRFHHYN